MHMGGTSKVRDRLNSSNETDFSPLCFIAIDADVSIFSARKLLIIWVTRSIKYRVFLYDL